MSTTRLPAALAQGEDEADVAVVQDRSMHRRLLSLALRGGSLLTFVVVMIVFASMAPFFLSFFNVTNVVAQSAVVGVLAFGLTVVIIGGGGNVVTGGIDLSVAANMGLSAAVYASVIQAGHGDGVAIAATLLTGLAVGAANALAVVGIGILPLLATLAVMNVVAGLELVLTQNTVIAASTPFLLAINDLGPFGVPVLAYVLLAATLVLVLVIQYSSYGLRLYAVGEHPEAARAAGLPVRTYVASTYLISGLCASIAGILSCAYLSGSSTGSSEVLLGVVVTALLGVVFSRRLVPTIGGTVLAALFIGFLANGFQLLNISSYWVSGVQGVLILLVVAATSILRRKES